MFNRGCDTIFNDSQQETNNHLNFLTPPIKKIFLSNEIAIPQLTNRNLFQTPQTKTISLCNSEQKTIQKLPSQNVIGNFNHVAQTLFKNTSLIQRSEQETQTLYLYPIEESKPCNCRKSKCLKLYCDCFAAGKLCSSKCNCCGCFNNSSNLLERNQYISKLMEKNPEVFNGKVQEIDKKMAHSKGCNCRKSGCQKKYCECYQSGIECSDNCKCDGCKNCSSIVNLFTKSQFSRSLNLGKNFEI